MRRSCPTVRALVQSLHTWLLQTSLCRRQGAEPVPFAASVGLGLALRFLVPIPAGITVQAWSLLSIFVSAIAGAAGLALPPVRMYPASHHQYHFKRSSLLLKS